MSTYLTPLFLQFIDKGEVKTILELGSRDAKDAVALHHHYSAKVYAFECNPESIPLCRETISCESQIELVPYAVWSKSGIIDFYPVDTTNGNTAHTGASSCMPLNFTERPWPATDEDRIEVCKQKKTTVQAIALDHWANSNAIGPVDLMCIDLEGAEVEALKGAEKLLGTVKYIISEVRHAPMQKGGAVLRDIRHELALHGFVMAAIEGNHLFGNALFVRWSHAPWKTKLRNVPHTLSALLSATFQKTNNARSLSLKPDCHRTDRKK